MSVHGVHPIQNSFYHHSGAVAISHGDDNMDLNLLPGSNPNLAARQGSSTCSMDIMLLEVLTDPVTSSECHQFCNDFDMKRENEFKYPGRLQRLDFSRRRPNFPGFSGNLSGRYEQSEVTSGLLNDQRSAAEVSAVNVAASALAILQEKQVSFSSDTSIIMEDAPETRPSISWRQQAKEAVIQKMGVSEELVFQHYHMEEEDKNIASIMAMLNQSERRSLQAERPDLNKNENNASIGSTISGFSEINESKKSLGSFERSFSSSRSLGPNFCNVSRFNSAQNNCSSPVGQPLSPMYVDCPSEPLYCQLELKSEHTNLSLFPTAPTLQSSATDSMPIAGLPSNYGNNTALMPPTLRRIPTSSTECSESKRNLVLPNFQRSSTGATSVESWFENDQDSPDEVENPPNLSVHIQDRGYKKSHSNESEDVPPLSSWDPEDYPEDRPSGFKTPVALRFQRDSFFEIDETLWVTIPRRSICRAEACTYRNNATLVSHRKHYHALCHHIHQTGEKRGMPFHHHQLEKIKKHQRAHQMQALRGSASSTSSPAHMHTSTSRNNIFSSISPAASPTVVNEPAKVIELEPHWSLHESEKLRLLAEAPGGGGWGDIAASLGTGRSEDSCRAKWMEICDIRAREAKAGVGSWSQEEDEQLKSLVKVFGAKWAQICNHMPGRVGKQCRERYLNHLDPSLKKTPWTEAEDVLLLELHERMQNSWADIARNIEGRCDNDVKNRWNLIQRRAQGRHTSSPVSQTNRPGTLHSVVSAANSFADYIRSPVRSPVSSLFSNGGKN